MTAPSPRLLSAAEAAAYCGRNKSWFYEHLPTFQRAAIRWDAKSDPLYDVRRLDQIIEERFKEMNNG